MKIYFSVDIETDGLVAGRNNMISLGCAAIDMDNGKIIGKFKANLSLVPDLVPDFDTMEWWKGFPEAYESARVNAVSPSFAIGKFVEWVERVKTKDSLIFAWKPSFDCAFLRYYIHRFHPKGTELIASEPYGRGGFGLDQKTVAAIALKQAYRDTKMSALPDPLRLDEKSNVIAQHSHDALEDAVEQAAIFYNCVRRLGVEL
jgi:DNA polymerase III alpha subunit (gram-positive type)